jgi:hypothetical protein
MDVIDTVVSLGDGRSMDPRLRLARTAMRGLSKLSPGVAGSLAEQLWFLVPRIPLSKDARTFLHSGRSF